MRHVSVGAVWLRRFPKAELAYYKCRPQAKASHHRYMFTKQGQTCLGRGGLRRSAVTQLKSLPNAVGKRGLTIPDSLLQKKKRKTRRKGRRLTETGAQKTNPIRLLRLSRLWSTASQLAPTKKWQMCPSRRKAIHENLQKNQKEQKTPHLTVADTNLWFQWRSHTSWMRTQSTPQNAL